MKTVQGLLVCAAALLLTWGCGRTPERPAEPVRRIARMPEPPGERVITAEDLPGADIPYEMPSDEMEPTDEIEPIEEIEAGPDVPPEPPVTVPAPPDTPETEDVIDAAAPAEDPVQALGELGIAFNRWAFIEAAGNGNLEAVKLFLEAGVNPNVLNSSRYGETALMWAARGGHADVAGALIAAGADVNMRNARDMTALGYALMFKRTGTADVIRDAGGVR